MKKILTILSIMALVFTSCSKDDSPSEETSSSSVLVKKMILTSTDEDNGSYWNNTINFSYNGTKLTQSIDEDGYKGIYTYTGDLITKIEYYNAPDILDLQDLFSYNTNGKLTEYRFLDISANYEYKFTYTYNSNGTVTVTEYQGTIGNTNVIPSTPHIYTFTNGELTSIDAGSGSVYSYTYDGKNNPFKNVTGYQKILNPDFLDDYQLVFGRNNNFLSRTYSLDSNLDINASYTYNNDNYPISSQNTSKFGTTIPKTVNVQYFY